jgi:hypothetical protein
MTITLGRLKDLGGLYRKPPIPLWPEIKFRYRQVPIRNA